MLPFSLVALLSAMTSLVLNATLVLNNQLLTLEKRGTSVLARLFVVVSLAAFIVADALAISVLFNIQFFIWELDLTVQPKWQPLYYTNLALFFAHLSSIYVQFSIISTYILPKSRNLLKNGLVSRRPVSQLAKSVKNFTSALLFIT